MTPPPPPTAPTSTGRCPSRVVIVDDSHAYRALLRTMLRREDDLEIVAEAADGATGIAAVFEHAPDLVVTDQQMPGKDGLELTRTVRASDPHVPILMLTASPQDGLDEQASDAGVTVFMYKGAGMAPILTTMRQVLVSVEQPLPAGS